MLNIPETIRELSNFTYDISETTDRIRYEAPQGFHDDIVIAQALAIWRLIPLYKERAEKPKTIIQEHYEKLKDRLNGENTDFDGSPEEFQAEWGNF